MKFPQEPICQSCIMPEEMARSRRENIVPKLKKWQKKAAKS